MSKKCKATASLSYSCSETEFSLPLPRSDDWQAINSSALRSRQVNDKYKIVKEMEQVEELARDEIINLPLYIISFSECLFLNYFYNECY